MTSLKTDSPARTPLTFEPIFMERIWGGRKLAELFRKNLPPNKPIGESWEIVDRPEAQSVVSNGPLKGKTLHELWSQYRTDIFGHLPDGPSRTGIPRFPLLIKLLDAQEKLSLQVHPPGKIAAKLGGEPKTECWYVASATSDADLFVGFKESTNREAFEKSLRAGSAADHVHTIRVKEGDAMFLPAGRFHAVGAGNVLVEIQQNSDTTYRVFDWNRVDEKTGSPRQLHVDQALESIDFSDIAPRLVEAKGELLVKDELFELQKWNLDSPREVTPPGQFAIVCCLSGSLGCADVDLRPGEFFLVPASLQDRQLNPRVDGTTLLRITI
jgi:mannose-6-phosphate isomerase